MELTSLQDIVNQFVDAYKTAITSSGHNASGTLQNSVQGFVDFDGRYFSVNLNIAEHWKNLEYGRKPGKFPPIDKIREWIRIKPVLPRAINGKLPTENQLAYLIGRKIATKGIQPTHLLEKTVENFALEKKIYNELEILIAKSFEKEVPKYN